MVLILLFVIPIFVMIRNNWVFSIRQKMLSKYDKEYYNLLTYDQMMIRFWVWNIEKLKK